MNLKQLLDLVAYDRTDAYTTVQIAYEECARAIRIQQYMFPIIFNKAFRSNHFETKHRIGDDYICFKEIRTIGKSTTGNPQELLSDINELEVFNFDYPTYHGIPESRFLLVNEGQTIVPDLVFKGDVVECSNVTGDVFAFIFGYPYPYFCNPITPIAGIDNYNIATLVATYGEQYLIVDEVLACLFIPKYLSIKSQQNGDLSIASNYDYHFVQIVNKFNENRETFQHNNWLSYDSIPANV